MFAKHIHPCTICSLLQNVHTQNVLPWNQIGGEVRYEKFEFQLYLNLLLCIHVCATV